jgi:hypothetical protein
MKKKEPEPEFGQAWTREIGLLTNLSMIKTDKPRRFEKIDD